MVAYQRARRRPSVWRRPLRHENITDASDGLQHLAVEVPVDLLAETEHQHVHDVRPRIEAVVPYVGEDHRLRDDTPCVAHQILEQRKLTGPERFDLASRA